MQVKQNFYINSDFRGNQLLIIFGLYIVAPFFFYLSGHSILPWLLYTSPFLLYFFKVFSYHLVIENGQVAEHGFLSRGRSILTQEITGIQQSQGFGHFTSMRRGDPNMPYFKIQTAKNFNKALPVYPLSPKFIDALKESVPNLPVIYDN